MLWNPATASLGNLIGWSFVPDFITGNLLALIYAFLRSIGRTPPSPGSTRAKTNYKYTLAFVISSYLVYCIIDSVKRTPPNLYEILAVPSNASENDLKAAFRFFARRHHPDRVGKQGEAVFISVRDAYDSLKDPLKRFAYDRFGRDALEWKESSIVDVLYKGCLSQGMFYISALVFLQLFSYIQHGDPVIFWRYFLLVALLAVELQLILLPHLNTPLSCLLALVFPKRVPYQHILFANQVYVSSSIALSRVFPVLLPKNPDFSDEAGPFRTLAVRLGQLIHTNEQHVSNLLKSEVQAIQQSSQPVEDRATGLPTPPPSATLDDETLELIREEIEKMIIDQDLRAVPGMSTAIEAATRRVKERREELERSPPPLENGHAAANGTGTPLQEDILRDTKSPSVTPSRFRLLSPESEDGRDSPRRVSVKPRERSLSP